MRVHNVAGNGEIVTVAGGAVDDDEGAPPALPPGGRVHVDTGAGTIVFASTSPQGELDLVAKREAAAARLASRKGTPAPRATGAPPATELPERELRLRCLEIASRDPDASPDKVLANARAMLAFVENG